MSLRDLRRHLDQWDSDAPERKAFARDAAQLSAFPLQHPTECLRADDLARVLDVAKLRDGVDASRVVGFVVNQDVVARDNDKWLTAGMDTTWFEQHGSLLWGHRADTPELVLGRPVAVVREPSRLIMLFEFAGAGMGLGDMVLRQIQAGMVSGASTRIRPLEVLEVSDRPGFFPVDVTKSEMLEVSVTPIPVLPEGVVVAASSTSDETVADERSAEEVRENQRNEAITFEESRQIAKNMMKSVQRPAITANVIEQVLNNLRQ